MTIDGVSVIGDGVSTIGVEDVDSGTFGCPDRSGEGEGEGDDGKAENEDEDEGDGNGNGVSISIFLFFYCTRIPPPIWKSAIPPSSAGNGMVELDLISICAP